MNRKSFFLKVWKNTTFKFTNANCWRMIGFYGCAFFAVYLLVACVWMSFMPLREPVFSADYWGVKYLQFLCILASVAYAYLMVRNNQKAGLLDKAEVTRRAWENTPWDDPKKQSLWERYLKLCDEAER